MAQQYVSDSGTIYLAGGYASYKVQKTLGGLSTTGVLMLVGEADQGPSYSEETKLADNWYTADEKAQVVAKYGSGPLVDAFMGASVPANDPDILGAPSAIYLIKTNTGVKAALNLLKTGGGIYASLQAKSSGKLGNGIYTSVVSATAESLPTTTFTYMPATNAGGTVLKICGNGGGTALNYSGGTTAQHATPNALVSNLNLSDAGTNNLIVASGGTDRNIVGASTAMLTVSVVSGAVLPTITITTAEPTGWAVAPVVSDTLYIATGSTIIGGATKNGGGYIVTASTTSTVTAIKLRNLAGTTPTASDVEAATGVANGNSFECYAPVTIAMKAAYAPGAGVVIDGYGKSLEINNSGAADAFSTLCWTLVGGSPALVGTISATGAGVNIGSAAEGAVTINLARQSDGASETWTLGGEIALHIGYNNSATCTAATVTISDTALTTVCTADTSHNLSLNLRDFRTVNDLVAYINSQQYYSCVVGSGFIGQQLLMVNNKCILDKGTFNIWGVMAGSRPGRIKKDAYLIYSTLSSGSSLASLASLPTAGYPAITAVSYLANGSKGSTTAAQVSAGIDACERLRGNFLVTLFSRDATNDIAEGITEASSTYTIDAINTAVKSHVLKMSTLKRRRNRQGFVSKKGTFAQAKTAAGTLASYRVAMAFQDSRNLNSAGELVQFPSWMLAVQAAGMQAAGFYRSILFKKINTSGVLMADGSFDDQFDPDLEDAVKNGLLVAQTDETGGFKWNNDQTTYGTDDNFVWNSIQAVYAADVVAMTLAQRMERRYVGQSLADVSASTALSFLKGIMADLKRLKLIASSDDAPLGFKNARIRIAGNVMLVDLEIKLATAIVFIPISFMVTQVVQEAAA